MISAHAQIQDPVSKDWLRIDLNTGRIVETSYDGPFHGVEVYAPRDKGSIGIEAKTVLTSELARLSLSLSEAVRRYDDHLNGLRKSRNQIVRLTRERNAIEHPLADEGLPQVAGSPAERVAAAFGAAMYGDGRPWGSFDERERDALLRGAYAALLIAEEECAVTPAPAFDGRPA